MAVSVVMPQLGESVVEGTITRWHVKEGDRIEKDQPLVTVSTDKADTDVPSPATGVITRLLAAEQQTVPVNTPIAELDSAMTTPAATPAESVSTVSSPAATSGTSPDADRARPTSPSVRSLAREHDLDLTKITGTGENGRVTRNDVQAHLDARRSAPPAATTAVSSSVSPVSVSVSPTPVTQVFQPPSVALSSAAPERRAFQLKAYTPSPGDEVVPFSRRRRIIAEHMVFSKTTAPHVYTFAEIDMHRVSRLRDEKKNQYRAEGVSLTFLAFIAAATARALRENPIMNSRVLDGAYVKLKEINLGVAVETPNGLLVPVVRNADELTVKGLARSIDSLAKKSRDGKIEADDLANATFTISNPGLKGNFVGAAVINQPNVGILRTGEIKKRPVVVEADGADTIAIHPVMFVALSYDHRIVDGVAANSFLHRLTELIESGSFEL